MKSVELFTGAGGLAIGTAMAGFHHLALVERDRHSCHTIREN
ncbi:MAG: DNA cytosine methyltransferase, partial [Cyanobacteria bacterium P01_C01_bin.38]